MDRSIGRYLGPAALTGAAVCLGVTHVAEKVAVEAGAGATAVALLRGTAALLLVAGGWFLWQRHSGAKPPGRRVWPHIALIGVLASGAAIALAILALRDTTATHKGIIQALYPVGTAAFAVVLLGERLTARGLAALAVATVGLMVLLSRGFEGAPNRGDWLLLATVPPVGFSDTWAKRTLESVAPLTLAAGRQLFGWLFLCVALGLTGLGGIEAAIASWPWIVGAGALAGVFVWLFYVGVERTSVTAAATALAGAPAVTAVLDYALLGEHLGALQITSMVLIVAGIVGVVRGGTA